MKRCVVNESVALIVHVSLLTTQLVTVTLVQLGLNVTLS